MARSSYIYVVTADPSRDVKGAFTVKHELRTWLEDKVTSGDLIPWETDWRVIRCADGPWSGIPAQEDMPTVWEFFEWPRHRTPRDPLDGLDVS